MVEPLLIVIPCLNEERHLRPLVEDLHRNMDDIPQFIVIADGGSTDRSCAIAHELMARFPNITLLENPQRLQSAAINLAVQRYGDKARYVIRIDAHAGYQPNFCRVLVEEAERMQADSVTVSMHTTGTDCFQKAVAAAQNSKLGNGGSAHRLVGKEGRWVDHGHHALMRISAFRAIGGYDESFSHNEDAELDIRLRHAGYKIWLTGKTEITYYPRGAALPLLWQYFNYGRGRAHTMLKHRSRLKLRQLAPVLVAPAFLLALLSYLTTIAALPLAIWVALCLGYGVIIALRGKDRCLWLTGVAAMLMHAAWSAGFWTVVIKGRR